MQCVVILGERETAQHEDEVLERDDELGVGKAGLAIEDKCAETAQRADVCEQGADNVGAAIKRFLVAAGKGAYADDAGNRGKDKTEGRKPQQFGRERQYPKAQQGEQRADPDDVEADEENDEDLENSLMRLLKLEN